jgi:hypothetical protein
MKNRSRSAKTAALTAALVLGGLAVVQAQEADTNATTIAYWKFGGPGTVPLSPSGSGILDLATNAGQGIPLPGTGLAPASVQDLWFQGPLGAAQTYSTAVPPSSMFNANHYFSAGTGSWNCGADQYPTTTGSLTCDNSTYGNAFNGPNFTFEFYFKSNTTNDSTTGTNTQVILFDHHQSAYAFVYLNDSANTNSGGSTNNIGSLHFWSWNVAVFGIDCRITAAQNHGQRLDDGHWHYAAARFDEATERMDLLVVNEDGTSAETSTYITVPLNPGGSGSQGPLFIGCDENQNEPFDGLINQIRYSDISLPSNQLLVNTSGCEAPSFNNLPSTNTVAAGAVLNFSPASWPIQVVGGPLQFQWQLNGTNISNQTNISLNLTPATFANAGSYQLVATTPCGGISATSAPIVAKVVQSIPLTRWSFEFTEAVTFPQATVDDVIPGENYDLITFNDEPNLSGIGGNGEIPLTNTVPPTAMFINGNNAGTNAFDASYLAQNSHNGVVCYPLGPDVFDFQRSFSVELFFKSYGDQSGNGTMALLSQGTDGGNTVRYSLNLNQTAPGALNFKINNMSQAPTNASYEDVNPGIQEVALTNANYADGNWHYLLATYDSTLNKISLAVANQNGSGTNATVTLPTGYSPLPAAVEGNLFVGRYRYTWTEDNRNFIGAIDEVQISSGLVTPGSGQLGKLPGTVTVPIITSIQVNGSTVTINFNGNPSDAASSFTVVGSAAVKGTYAALAANITSLGSGKFQATIATSGSSQYYRIQR